jgi:hypothetical protein
MLRWLLSRLLRLLHLLLRQRLLLLLLLLLLLSQPAHQVAAGHHG